MGDEPTRALLLIADIGGYTRFMRLHRLSLAHSQQITGRLLEAMTEAADGGTLVELEGDAAFFYAPETDLGEIAFARGAARHSFARHPPFHTERGDLVRVNRSSGDAGLRGWGESSY